MNLQSLLAGAAGVIERSEHLDAPADRLHEWAAKIMPGRRRGWLAGTWLGHPLHPFLVSVPIGCWTSASLLDVLGQRQGARTLIGAGAASALPTAMVGLSDWLDTSGAERRVGFVHLTANTIATGVYAGSWWARRHQRHGLGVGLAVLGAGVASGGGGLGGALGLRPRRRC
jgi:hypothetical protein